MSKLPAFNIGLLVTIVVITTIVGINNVTSAYINDGEISSDPSVTVIEGLEIAYPKAREINDSAVFCGARCYGDINNGKYSNITFEFIVPTSMSNYSSIFFGPGIRIWYDNGNYISQEIGDYSGFLIYNLSMDSDEAVAIIVNSQEYQNFTDTHSFAVFDYLYADGWRDGNIHYSTGARWECPFAGNAECRIYVDSFNRSIDMEIDEPENCLPTCTSSYIPLVLPLFIAIPLIFIRKKQK